MEHAVLGQPRSAAGRVAVRIRRFGGAARPKRKDAGSGHVSAARNAVFVSGRGNRHDKFPVPGRDAAPRCGEPQSACAGPKGWAGGLGMERHPQKGPRQCAHTHAVGCFRERRLYRRNAVDRCKSELPADQRASCAGRPGFDPAFLSEAAGAAAELERAAQRDIPSAPAGASAASCLRTRLRRRTHPRML